MKVYILIDNTFDGIEYHDHIIKVFSDYDKAEQYYNEYKEIADDPRIEDYEVE